MFQWVSRVFAVSAMGALVAALVLSQPASAQSGQSNQSTISGMCTDSEGIGLGGVQCKVFVNGFMKGQGISGGDGSYTATFEYDPLADQSIVVWWLPQAGYVPEIAVLRESKTAAALAIWSPCLPRLDLGGSIGYDVTIFDENAKFAQLGESDCIQ